MRERNETNRCLYSQSKFPSSEDKDDDKTGYWNNMTLAEFAANYEIVYKSRVKQTKDVIKLRNNKGFVAKRGQECVIRYFLRHEHEQEHHRALCVLFLPFRNEMHEIHEKNVTALYLENQKEIEELRGHFEKNRKTLIFNEASDCPDFYSAGKNCDFAMFFVPIISSLDIRKFV